MSTRARDGMNRLHRVITRALDVLRTEAGDHAVTWEQTARLQGYALYARCTLDLLHAHHLAEDEIVFPRLQAAGPRPEVAALAAEHAAVEAAVADLRVRLGQLASGVLSPTGRAGWRGALAALRDAWDAHVRSEEAFFDEALVGLDPEEDVALARRVDRHGRANAGSGAVMLPFILFNLTGADRAEFEGRLPWILTGLLIPRMWRRRWGSMAPLLAEPPP